WRGSRQTARVGWCEHGGLSFEGGGGPRSPKGQPVGGRRGSPPFFPPAGRNPPASIVAGTGTERCIRFGRGAIGGSTAISISSARRSWPSACLERERSRTAPT